MFGGLSGYKIPQSLKRESDSPIIQSISKACAARRATGGQRKILRRSCPLSLHTRITSLLPHIGKRNSLPLRRRAGEGELPRRGKRGRPGPRPRPAVYWCGGLLRADTVCPCQIRGTPCRGGYHPPARITSPIPSANSLAARAASSGLLPAAPTSTRREPVVACWL